MVDKSSNFGEKQKPYLTIGKIKVVPYYIGSKSNLCSNDKK